MPGNVEMSCNIRREFQRGCIDSYFVEWYLSVSTIQNLKSNSIFYPKSNITNIWFQGEWTCAGEWGL